MNARKQAFRLGVAAILALLLLQPMIVLAQDESDLAGEYSVGISREDLPTDIAGIFSYIGRWRVAFNPDGTYEAERLDLGVMVTGEYSVDGNEVTITDHEGLLSCAYPGAATISEGDISTGVYEWSIVGEELELTVQEDNCAGRVWLLTTHPFTAFVACTTEPLQLADIEDEPAGTPTAEEPATPEAVEDDDDDSPLDILTPDAEPDTDTGGEAPDLEGDLDTVAVEIDALLSQMSACWATGDPSLWLPLLSDEFRDALLGGSEDFEATLSAAMSAPIVWERAGDLAVEGPNQVSAIVRSTVGPEEDFQRFLFVFEDGEWRWDG